MLGHGNSYHVVPRPSSLTISCTHIESTCFWCTAKEPEKHFMPLYIWLQFSWIYKPLTETCVKYISDMLQETPIDSIVIKYWSTMDFE